MKAMWKHGILAVLGFAIVFGITGCGSGASTQQDGTAPPSSVGAGQGRDTGKK